MSEMILHSKIYWETEISRIERDKFDIIMNIGISSTTTCQKFVLMTVNCVSSELEVKKKKAICILM